MVDFLLYFLDFSLFFFVNKSSVSINSVFLYI